MRSPRTLRWSAVSALILTACLTAICAAQTAAPAQLATGLNAILDRLSSTGAVIHARVVELPSGRELYARRADEACIPASNFKLLVTAAGLDMFGPHHTFKTYLAQDGEDLWLIGTGDPGTGDYRLAKAAGETPVTMLERWALELERRGIRRIAGDLVYYDGAFDRQLVHPAWYKHFLVDWYAAPVAGLNFNDNTIDITVFPGEPGKPARYEVMPPVDNIKVINNCITGDKKAPSIQKSPGEHVYTLSGGCTERKELISKPIDDPGAFFAEALRVQLAKRGIQIAGQVRRSETPLDGVMPPPAAKIIATHETKITDVLARINKNSQNMFAECMSKLTGQAFEAQQGRRVPGSWESGAAALHAFLKKCGIDDAQLSAIDGSGLSDRNRVTTRMLTELLTVMFSRPDSQVYRDSLTIAGVDGSLLSRMPGLKGKVYGKTGYIGGVCSTSGYLQTRKGQWLAFSFIYNKVPRKAGSSSDIAEFQKLHDETCTVLYEWPEVKLPVETKPAE
ncbi:MAG TPA: D-alanyl-D-alanine carboxypeptidase/D-alanyl-D-alanine-endopeptidase [Phycisphaerae bacterium]|nr:D-alanyl-D-alanine carboxypeptidase/D-alanyl-D-alanine-endopeptidase [Phycisphaerae bacterium]HOB73535.1 D-alanyl-D-alanine carboxypeptidase/D-alanyl-D-alanine-endopeptidase [Phycisphaerae bacterium]HOJ54143.1 D-alanyl-D-alanine carboxypeptidase/D-alanyl-D-alanine-endopeptidase [Phycisphaerae bacterium]HOL25564.1 D-alanyl-D-alanine carboxypeptidase/D-alanyl-D-alanine-endopeptidase [Phycisphaerae bacterium]HPP21003.1 D-alanyl-D-alanine carboxypeptidase/D-alanyl-D-alanine-endopeptidase [Phycis